MTSSASGRRLGQRLLVAILLTVLAPAVSAQAAADPGRLPLIASCELPLIGRMELRLKEIHLK